ncbi:Arylsulfatase [Cytospora mali]|uniref:Arylsulfatase n=1 Tax=Cytospora mali TaxID=578113 RepID=A0A194V2H6_CYTMA|nr:Arylsulfatase [Valsa mali var. pyri (nom. inval.)]
MWTGKAAHNTNVTDLRPPYGGYPKFIDQGFNEKYLPVWLQAAGYNTYYVGKLFNAHSIWNYDNPCPMGWTGSEFLLDPYTYEYWNATMQRNRDPPRSYEGQYSTDVIAEKTYGFLHDALQSERPFFLTIAPTAPHSNVKNGTQSPPRPADRHKHLFPEAKVPRTPSFNPDTPSGVSWISRLPIQSEGNVEYNDEWYRNRLRTLQAVDEMIDTLVKKLDDAGALESTYIFFSTDNGYSIGQHRRQPGKQCAFEDDINIPLIVRGPGVPKNHVSDVVTSHTDIAPTILEIAGVDVATQARYELDGAPIPLHSSLVTPEWKQEHVNVEMWGIILSEGKYGFDLYHNHTYKAVRVIGEGYSFLYTVWCSGEHELYDMINDPWQMKNIYGNEDDEHYLFNVADDSQSSNLRNIVVTRGALKVRLDALLLVLKSCQQEECRSPWRALHPMGGVWNLKDALHVQYDDMYACMPRVEYDKCERGYIPGSEGAMWDGSFAFSMKHEVWDEL